MTQLQVKTNTLEGELKKRAEWVELDCVMLIQNDDEYNAAMQKAEEVKSLEKGIEDYWRPLIHMAHQNHVLLKRKEKSMLDPVKAGLEKLGGLLIEYRSKRERLERDRQEAEHQKQIEEADLAAFELAEEGVPQEAIDAVREMKTETPFHAQPTQELRSRSSFKPDYIVTIEDIDEVDREFLVPSTKAHREAIINNARAKAIKTGGKPLKGFKIISTEKINFKGAK